MSDTRDDWATSKANTLADKKDLSWAYQAILIEKALIWAERRGFERGVMESVKIMTVSEKFGDTGEP